MINARPLHLIGFQILGVLAALPKAQYMATGVQQVSSSAVPEEGPWYACMSLHAWYCMSHVAEDCQYC